MAALVGSGVLGPGGSGYFDVVLNAGVTYGIYVNPSEPTVDFDLYVYDENGNRVALDASTDSHAMCIVKPRWTGPFRLQVKSARGASTYAISVQT